MSRVHHIDVNTYSLYTHFTSYLSNIKERRASLISDIRINALAPIRGKYGESFRPRKTPMKDRWRIDADFSYDYILYAKKTKKDCARKETHHL